MTLPIPRFIQVPLSEIEFTFVRSSGPGGQNVNKVNSKAILRWNLISSAVLSLETRDHLLEKLSNQLTREGDLLITSDRFRDQIRNREDCLQKLDELISRALFVPKPRKKTKQSYSSQKRDQQAKSTHARKKQLRKRINHDV